jgi:putrescine---pyruvate transaminase
VSLPAFLHPFARPRAEHFIEMVRGEGATVWDRDGKAYVDGLASLWYCQIGHGRREVADAVAGQLATLGAFHTFEMFTNEPADRLCEELVRRAPIPGCRVFLTCSGSEAVDTAIKLARLAMSLQGQAHRRTIVSRHRAYHGVTYGGLSAQGLPPNKEHFGPLVPDVVQVDPDDLGEIEELMAERGGEVAAVIAEPLQGAGGVHPAPDGYLKGLRALCDEHGALLVFDEVITGFGRLGGWWAAEQVDVIPDLVTFAKGATSGYQPLGGVLVGRAVLDVLEADEDRWLRHGFTYSGHPAACAAALVNIEVLAREELPARAPVIGERLRSGLQPLVDEGLATDLRGAGAIWGLGMPADVSAMAVRDRMLERGVIPRPIATHTVALCPPLVIDDAQVDQIVEVTGEALRSVAHGR